MREYTKEEYKLLQEAHDKIYGIEKAGDWILRLEKAIIRYYFRYHIGYPKVIKITHKNLQKLMYDKHAEDYITMNIKTGEIYFDNIRLEIRISKEKRERDEYERLKAKFEPKEPYTHC